MENLQLDYRGILRVVFEDEEGGRVLGGLPHAVQAPEPLLSDKKTSSKEL